MDSIDFLLHLNSMKISRNNILRVKKYNLCQNNGIQIDPIISFKHSWYLVFQILYDTPVERLNSHIGGNCYNL